MSYSNSSKNILPGDLLRLRSWYKSASLWRLNHLGGIYKINGMIRNKDFAMFICYVSVQSFAEPWALVMTSSGVGCIEVANLERV